MSETLFNAVSTCSKELMKFGLTVEEFAALAQQNNMSDAEVLAVAKVFEYLKAKKDRSTVDFLLRTSRLPLKVPKTFDNFDFNRVTGKNVDKLRSLSLRYLPSMPTKTLPLLENREPAKPIWHRLLAAPVVSMA